MHGILKMVIDLKALGVSALQCDTGLAKLTPILPADAGYEGQFVCQVMIAAEDY
jgi:hypothetical protein